MHPLELGAVGDCSNAGSANDTPQLVFDVVGAVGEQVQVTLVTPSSTVIKVDCTLGLSGGARVACSGAGCTVTPA